MECPIPSITPPFIWFKAPNGFTTTPQSTAQVTLSTTGLPLSNLISATSAT